MAQSQDDMLLPKAALRRRVAEAVARLSPAARRMAAERLAERVAGFPAVQAAETLMAYLALPTEIDTWPLIRRAWDEGKRIAVPRIEPPLAREAMPVHERRIVPVELAPLDVAEASLHPAVEPGAYGILEVRGLDPFPAEAIDVVLAPCAAVDRHGRRLGKGGGFYDRFLARPELNATVVALAFAAQLVESVPVAAWDRPVDAVVTDAEAVVGGGTVP